MIDSLDDLLEVKPTKKARLVVTQAEERHTLEAVVESISMGLVEGILVGNRAQIEGELQSMGKELENCTIIDSPSVEESAIIATKLVREGRADFLMKGLIDTSILLKAVLNKDTGIRGDRLLSHVMIYDVDTYNKLIYLTDGGMNISPSLEQKKDIIENAVEIYKKLGDGVPKVAVLSAKEKCDKNIKSTTDAVLLKESYKGSKYLLVDGPMALDLAISKEAASIKNYDSPVAGEADIFLAANIEMGNGIGKSITYLAGGKSAGLVMGARAPIILTSRSDSYMNKLYSIALGAYISNKQ